MRKYKAAVIGLGNIGLLYDFEPQRIHPSTHMFAYKAHPAFDIACAIDGDESKKIYLEKISDGIPFFKDLNLAYSASAFEDVDVVSICTPPEFHFEIIKFLVERGIGRVIFCEKPLVMNSNEANALRSLMSGKQNIRVLPNISRRWNKGLRKVSDIILKKNYGELQKINIRYTRGIYNTGAHLFDLLRMWTGDRIERVRTLALTKTSAEPEKSFSFFFEQGNGVTGYAEAMDDAGYYLFEIDLFFSDGKIEMRNSGDNIFYYRTQKHHLFQGFHELVLEKSENNLLSDTCLKNAVDNIAEYLENSEAPCCSMEDAIYPLYVSEALEESYKSKQMEEVCYE